MGSNHIRKEWLEKNKVFVDFLILFSATIAIYLFSQFQTFTQLVVLFLSTISILYPFGLRTIPFVKIFIISLVWTVSTILLLVIENNILITVNIIFHIIARFLFVFAITIPFDIRDLSYDIGKVRTIPLVFGVLKAKFFAVFALFICVVIAFYQHFQNNLIFHYLLAVNLLYFIASIFILKSEESNGEIYFSFLIESISILYYLFLVISILIF
tara:strand:- start:118 stop:756 length:639 start_codon:yes stop_codon:yes gene_type:complete